MCLLIYFNDSRETMRYYLMITIQTQITDGSSEKLYLNMIRFYLMSVCMRVYGNVIRFM